MKLENNNDLPGIDAILKLCNTLNAPIEFLLKDNGNRLYTAYANSFIYKQMSDMSDEEFRVFSKTMSALYSLYIDDKENAAITGDTKEPEKQ